MSKESLNFIEEIIENDLLSGKVKEIVTRFPPEPNGYLHIGHAKSICLNFGIAKKYKSKCNLRFDDTNPEKESEEFVKSIIEDIEWLGFKWEGNIKYTSDYFSQLHDWAVKLIEKGKAYVDFQSGEDIAMQKGTPTQAGKESKYRNNSIDENLDFFKKMKNGFYKEGDAVLRAKIDMASPNMHMRDPIMYRILDKEHHRTKDKWKIYPMYDYAHGQSDYIEGISHSICTLEFEVHRPLYEWFLDSICDTEQNKPVQYEFSRLNLGYTVMSKRKLMELVEKNHVSGWDDPRMPTISGLRRRGYTPESIIKFCEVIGVSKRENLIDIGLLEEILRNDLNKKAKRVMAVLNPVKLIIENYSEGKKEILKSYNNPKDKSLGFSEITFSRELFIERDDFMEEPTEEFFRLKLGGEVRLKNAYIVKAHRIEKDSNGNVVEIYCTYDPQTKSDSGSEASKRKVKGTIHWVDSSNCIDAEVRVYDRLFLNEKPDLDKDKIFLDFVNKDSLHINKNCKLERSLEKAELGYYYQFQRLGYFCLDKDSTGELKIFNRTVSLKDSWAKVNIVKK